MGELTGPKDRDQGSHHVRERKWWGKRREKERGREQKREMVSMHGEKVPEGWKMSGLYEEEPLGKKQPRPWAGRFRVAGSVYQQGVKGAVKPEGQVCFHM